MRFTLYILAALASATPLAAQTSSPGQPSRDPAVRALIARWEGENRQCVGRQGAAVPCARRQITSRKLRQRGWCYGRLDQVGLLYDWHRCGRAG